MKERANIRIAKKHCNRIEAYYRDGIEVVMLPTSIYAGYKAYVPMHLVSDGGLFYEIKRHSNPDWKFILEKIEREPGKRYERPRRSFDELKDDFAEHSAAFYSDELPQALFYLLHYADNGTRRAGEVVGRSFCVGGYDNTWFYESDTQRRRLNTNGVRLLKRLLPEEVEPMKEKIVRYYQLRGSQEEFKRCLISKREYFYSQMEIYLPADEFATVSAKIDEINGIVQRLSAGAKAELEELDKYFKAFLEGKGVNIDD